MLGAIVVTCAAFYLIDKILHWVSLYSNHFGEMRALKNSAEALLKSCASSQAMAATVSDRCNTAERVGLEWREACLKARAECEDLRRQLRERPVSIAIN